MKKWLIGIVCVLILAVAGVLIGLNWNALTSNSQLYTNEQMQESYEKGLSDGNVEREDHIFEINKLKIDKAELTEDNQELKEENEKLQSDYTNLRESYMELFGEDFVPYSIDLIGEHAYVETLTVKDNLNNITYSLDASDKSISSFTFFDWQDISLTFFVEAGYSIFQDGIKISGNNVELLGEECSGNIITFETSFVGYFGWNTTTEVNLAIENGSYGFMSELKIINTNGTLTVDLAVGTDEEVLSWDTNVGGICFKVTCKYSDINDNRLTEIFVITIRISENKIVIEPTNYDDVWTGSIELI